jgi:hypothetical protein
MIKVLRHADTISVQNPVTGVWQDMVNVVFSEEGREGANKSMSETSDYLSQLVGQQAGLSQIRVHTHPVNKELIDGGQFAVGSEWPGHINRELHSNAQMNNQVDRAPRMIDGLPTYFKTKIGPNPEEDKDYRDKSTAKVISIPDHLLQNMTLRGANVKTLKRADNIPSLTQNNQLTESARVPVGATGS